MIGIRLATPGRPGRLAVAASFVSFNGLAVAQVAPGPAAASTTIDTASAAPLPRDPHVIVGTLPNGIRYYIRP